MKTNPIYLENGCKFAFEINNTYISISKAGKIIMTAKGVSDVQVRRLFSLSDRDIHIKFKYFGENFILLEPYGDSSDFWIGPEHEDVEIDISPLEHAFQEYKLPFLIKFIGDLISLDFKSLFRGECKKGS